jgi:hypothetical protein
MECCDKSGKRMKGCKPRNKKLLDRPRQDGNGLLHTAQGEGNSGNKDLQWEALSLFSYSKLLDNVAVPIDIAPFQVIQQSATLAYHFEQPAAGMVVFLVKLEVVSKIADLFAEDGYLHLRRPRVRGVQLVIIDETGFLFFIQTQCTPPKTKIKRSIYHSTARECKPGWPLR